jgi:hypothetical protein
MVKTTQNRGAKKTRVNFGLITIRHRGKLVVTSVGSKGYESLFSGLETSRKHRSRKLGTIPFGYQHRPELISNLFMGTAVSWWQICERNSIFDVFEQMNTGDGIFIPDA